MSKCEESLLSLLDDKNSGLFVVAVSNEIFFVKNGGRETTYLIFASVVSECEVKKVFKDFHQTNTLAYFSGQSATKEIFLLILSAEEQPILFLHQ